MNIGYLLGSGDYAFGPESVWRLRAIGISAQEALRCLMLSWSPLLECEIRQSIYRDSDASRVLSRVRLCFFVMSSRGASFNR